MNTFEMEEFIKKPESPGAAEAEAEGLLIEEELLE